MHKSQGQNKKEAFQKLGQKILLHHKKLDALERIREKTEDTIRTYHKVENRVKDHESGFRQSYDEVMDDIEPMIQARKDVMNGGEV